MTVRQLSSPMTTWRIGDANGRFPIFSADGAVLSEGRWHRKGQAVIYTSQNYGTALLEKLAHWNGILPPNQHYITVTIPTQTTYEVVTKDQIPNWADKEGRAARAFGAAWIEEARSTLLIVPSVVSREETNVLINPHHPDAGGIAPSLERPVTWDARLFAR